MPRLNRLASLFRSRPSASPAELQAYANALGPLPEHLGGVYARWRAGLEVVAADDEMANAASIQRWEAAGMLDRLHAIQAPPPLARAHAELEAIVSDTARASQLLSNGYRFTSSRARCEGQALMLDAEERFAALHRELVVLDLSAGHAPAFDARLSE